MRSFRWVVLENRCIFNFFNVADCIGKNGWTMFVFVGYVIVEVDVITNRRFC